MIIHGAFNLDDVQTLRGHVDLYCWNGLMVGRKWPILRTKSKTDAQDQTRQDMRDAMIFAWDPRYTEEL